MTLARRLIEQKGGVEIWRILGEKYSVIVWQEIRWKQNKVSWHKLLSSMSIPKHVLISWMAILNRLPTMDRLALWGVNVRETCSLCLEELETRDHIFFGCKYSKEIWKRILLLCELKREVGTWTEELQWAEQKIKGKVLISIVLRMAWKALIYHIWCERNRRLHNGDAKSSSQMLERIKGEVCIKLAGLKNVAADDVNRRICSNWGLDVELLA